MNWLGHTRNRAGEGMPSARHASLDATILDGRPSTAGPLSALRAPLRDGKLPPPVAALASTLQPGTLKRRLVAADMAAVLVGVAGAFVFQRATSQVDSAIWLSQLLLIFAAIPVWALGAGARGLYTARANVRRWDEFRHIVASTFYGVGFLVGVAFLLDVDGLSRVWVALVFLLVAACVTVERHFARAVFLRLRTSGRLSRPILIVGADGDAAALARTLLRRADLGYCPVGYVSDDAAVDVAGLVYRGRLEHVDNALATTGANGVVISLRSVDAERVNKLTRRLVDRGVHVALVSSLHDIDISRLRIQELDGQALLYVEPSVRSGWRRKAKRIFDLALATSLLVLTAPIVAVVAVLIRVESPGPIFFRQWRVGLDGALFEMIKLRTMCDGAHELREDLLELNEADGPMFKLKSDPRVTRVGRHLRKLSIDELPQFWNVVRGEMSVVGPRPALPGEVDDWDVDLRDRLRVLPGISGLWQVSGRSNTTFEEYKRLDLYYVDNWSLAHDLRIVARTIGVVVRGKGAS